MIKEKNRSDIAIIINSKHYTYSELLNDVCDLRCNTNFPKHKKVIIIKEKSIYKQLIYFIAYSGSKYIPLIVAPDMCKLNINLLDLNIPKNAHMAVLSSGTTGVSKIYFRSFESWYNFFDIQNSIFKITAKSRIFVNGNLSFTGNLNMYLAILFAGATIVTTDNFNAKNWYEHIVNFKVNSIYLIPSKLKLFTKIKNQICDEINTIIAGSQSFNLKDLADLKKMYPKSLFILYYGSSELSYITYITDKGIKNNENIIGRPFPNVNLHLDNGEIIVNTPYGVEGLEMPYSSGDLGYLDENGDLYFLGKKENILNIHGRKISPEKVEKFLLEVKGIEQSFVTIDEREILTAYLVLDKDWLKKVEKREILNIIKEHLNQALERFEIPKVFIFKENLEKTDSGKLKR